MSKRGRSRIALIGGAALFASCYAAAIFADFLAPYDYKTQSRREPFAPPSVIRSCPIAADGSSPGLLCLYQQRLVDPLTRRYEFDARSAPVAVEFLPRGYAYKLGGLIETDRHLFGLRQNHARAATQQTSAPPPRLSLLGTDQLGRDRFSRLIVAARFSLLAGPLGTLLAATLGVFVGCVAGYAPRIVDALFMRAADVLLSLPTLMIILAVRAAFPLELPPGRAAMLLILIFTLVGWAEMSRLARALVLTLREREFVLAGRALGLSEARLLFRHILPNAARPLLTQAALMLPTFLLAEVALSFLGVGLQEPEPSWGGMLTEATDITLLGARPFVLLAPALAVFAVSLGAHLTAEGIKSRSGGA